MTFSRPLVAVILWTLFVLFLLLTPGSAVPSHGFLDLPDWSDKIVHAFLFFGEAFFLIRWQTNRWAAVGLASALALGTEIAQHWIPQRSADPWDLVANFSGIALAVILCRRGRS